MNLDEDAAYELSIRERLTFRHVRGICRTRSQEFLRVIFRNRRAQPVADKSETQKKEYQSPTIRKLTLEQAKLVLIGHATMGDQGAKELMDLVFPGPSDLGTRSPDGPTA
jgi:hypothetical protein